MNSAAFLLLASVALAVLPARAQDRPPPRRDRGPEKRYSIEQAISDRAQLHTIAFDGLAFLTGSLACDTFLPPGKVSDFFGFQYLRDIDAAELGTLLQKAGYATAHFGKWHVGRTPPSQHGFDQHDGPNTNVGPDGDRTPNPEQGEAITDRGLLFVEAQVRAGRPFYLQLEHYGGGKDKER